MISSFTCFLWQYTQISAITLGKIGEQFHLTVVEELAKRYEVALKKEKMGKGEKEEFELEDFFLAEMQSYRGFLLTPFTNYSKQIQNERLKKILLEQVKRKHFQCSTCPDQFNCKKLIDMQERFGKEEWFEKLMSVV